MYENFLYLFEMDFAQSAILINQGVSVSFGPLTSTFNTPTALIPTPCDMWIGERNIPSIGNLRIGIQKEPFGFERLVNYLFGLHDRIILRQDAFWIKGKDGKPNEHGLGAWQVGLRYNYLNLNEEGNLWRRPERHHAGPELVPQPEHEVAVQLQYLHQLVFARDRCGTPYRTKRRINRRAAAGDGGEWRWTSSCPSHQGLIKFCGFIAS